MHLEPRIPGVVTTALLFLVLGHATLIGQSAVVGRVVDTSGQPLPGVTVIAMPAAARVEVGGAPRTWREVTYADEDGRFSEHEVLSDGCLCPNLFTDRAR